MGRGQRGQPACIAARIDAAREDAYERARRRLRRS